MQATMESEKSLNMFSGTLQAVIVENLKQINTLIAETAEILKQNQTLAELQQFVEDEDREFDEYMLRMYEYYSQKSY
jgi:hypothetical protein